MSDPTRQMSPRRPGGPPRRRTRPRPRPQPRRRPEHVTSQQNRILAVVGVVVLLLVGIVVLVALGSVDTSDDKPVSTGGGVANPTATAEPRAPSPTATAASDGGGDGEPKLSAEEAKARQAALAQVRAQGFRPVDPNQWRSGNQLRVLTGRATKDSGKQGMLAFFFLGEEYLGTDTTAPSAKIAVGRQSNTTIALRYTTFKPDDEACCPSGPEETVRYRFTGGKLVPQEDIPSPDSRLKAGG